MNRRALVTLLFLAGTTVAEPISVREIRSQAQVAFDDLECMSRAASGWRGFFAAPETALHIR
jgi:hypothetical protein